LRAHALGEAPLGFLPLGLAVLYRRGVVGWLMAEREGRTSRTKAPERRGAIGTPAAEAASADDAGERVGLLASAALRVARGGAR